MNVVKVRLLLATLLSSMVGTVGCATGQSFSTPPLDSVLSNVNQPAMQSTDVGQIADTRIASNSLKLTKEIQAATSTAKPVVQTSYSQTVLPTSNVLAAVPLSTLGSGDDLFNKLEHASGVVLLDFYADWCGPCRTQGGILHEMELTAKQNHASIIKINVDQHRQLASMFNVTSMPTLVLVKDGLIIDRQTGVANHQEIASLLSR